MANNLLRWKPYLGPSVVGYEISFSDDGKSGTYAPLNTVLNSIPGPNWDAGAGVFFYNDNGPSYRWYQIATLDRTGNRAEHQAPQPIQGGNDPIVAPPLYSIGLNQDTGTEGAYRYVMQNGEPVADATVRVFRKTDWDANNQSDPVGITKTDENGNWEEPINVEPGYTYTIVVQKQYAFGPDTAEITL